MAWGWRGRDGSAPRRPNARPWDGLRPAGRTCRHALSECGRGGFAFFSAGLGGQKWSNSSIARPCSSKAEVRSSFITTTVREESHHKGATGRVRTGDQRLPVLCHCQLGQDISTAVKHISSRKASLAARVAGTDAPARGGPRRPHGDRGGADGEGGKRQRRECEWAGPGRCGVEWGAARQVMGLRNSQGCGMRSSLQRVYLTQTLFRAFEFELTQTLFREFELTPTLFR